MNLQITGLSTEALLSQLEFEELGKANTITLVKRLLRAWRSIRRLPSLPRLGLRPSISPLPVTRAASQRYLPRC